MHLVVQVEIRCQCSMAVNVKKRRQMLTFSLTVAQLHSDLFMLS